MSQFIVGCLQGRGEGVSIPRDGDQHHHHHHHRRARGAWSASARLLQLVGQAP